MLAVFLLTTGLFSYVGFRMALAGVCRGWSVYGAMVVLMLAMLIVPITGAIAGYAIRRTCGHPVDIAWFAFPRCSAPYTRVTCTTTSVTPAAESPQ